MKENCLMSSGIAEILMQLWLASYYGCTGFLMPYFNVILAHLGYNGSQIGVISALRPFTAVLCGPVWAAFADIKQSHRSVLLLCVIVSSMARATLGLLARPFWYLIVLVVLVECFGSPISALSDAAVMAATSTDGCYGTCRLWACVTYNAAGVISSMLMHDVNDSALFAIYAATASIAVLSASHLDMSLNRTLTDPTDVTSCDRSPCSTATKVSQNGCCCNDERSDYSIEEPLLDQAAGPTGPISPPTAPHSSDTRASLTPGDTVAARRLAVNVCSHAAGESPDVVPGVAHCDLCSGYLQHQESPEGDTFSTKLSALLQDPRVLAFLAKALLMGVCLGVIDGYLFVYLDRLGAPPLLMGACLAVVSSAEIPIFAFSGHILRILGYNGALQAGLAAFCMRLFAYSCLSRLPSLWFVLPVELLHGVTFGVAWCGGVNLCTRIAPVGLECTVQSMFSGTYAGLGKGLGGLAAGLVLQRCGGMHLFRWSFYGTVSCWGLISLLERTTAGAQTCAGTSERATVSQQQQNSDT